MLAQIRSSQLSPYEVARATCEHWGVRKFEREMEEHLTNGFVVVTPSLFLLAKAVELPDGRHAWSITHAIGDLPRLLNALPFRLPWFAWKRRWDQRRRIYPEHRIASLITTLQKERRL